MAQDGAMPQPNPIGSVLEGLAADLQISIDRQVPYLDAQPEVQEWLQSHRFKSVADVPRERQGELFDAIRAQCVDKNRRQGASR